MAGESKPQADQQQTDDPQNKPTTGGVPVAAAGGGGGGGNLPPSNIFWALVSGPSAIFGGLGVVLLLGAVIWLGVQGLSEDDHKACVVPPVAPGIQSTSIVKVEPGEWRFRRQLCVFVQNVISTAEETALQRGVDKAQTALSEATADKLQAALTDLAAAKAALAKQIEYQLFINGGATDLTAFANATAAPQALVFKRVAPNEDATSKAGIFWREILAQPSANGLVPIEIGLAPKGIATQAITSRDMPGDGGKNLKFRLFDPWVRWLTLAGMALVVIGLGGLSYKTALLRDGKTNDTAYSLSRVQMAFWLVLSTGGFIYVWMVTGQYTNVFPSALFVLIGISGAAAGASLAIDAAQQTNAAKSRNIFHDIAGASVGGEVQLHRLQIIAWTVILGVIFCWNVVSDLKLTGFDTNLLLLAGVANGVYVTLKTQEK